jgi:hypothetical protein
MKQLIKNTICLIFLSVFLTACATQQPVSIKDAKQADVPEGVITVNHQTFTSQIIEYPGTAIVLFYNTEFWQSMDMLKRLEWMADRYPGKARFAKFHWQVGDDASQFNLEMLPTTIMYQHGSELDRIKGIPPAESDRAKWNDDLELWFLKTGLNMKGSKYTGKYTYKFKNTHSLKIGNY